VDGGYALLLFSLQMLVCVVVFEILFLDFLLQEHVVAHLVGLHLWGFFYYFYMIDLLLQHECKVPAHLFEFCFLVLFIRLQCQTGLGALDSLIMKICLVMPVLFCYAYYFAMILCELSAWLI